MSKLYTLLILMLCTSSGIAQTTNGLVAHWTFNGNVLDATSNGHNGIATNITYTQGSTGVANTAAQFNGTSSYIKVPYQSDMNMSNYTISTRIKLNGFYTGLCQGNIVLQRGTEYGPGYYLLQLFDNHTDSSCTVTGDTSNFIFSTGTHNRGAYLKHWADTPTIRTDRWYCVTATYDSFHYKIYIDGVLSNTVVPIILGTQVSTSTQDLYIGANRYGNFGLYPYWLNGAIDDLRLYNRALTAAEISTLCSVTSPDTSVVITSLSDTSFCRSSSITANYTANFNYNSGNTFTLQLSNSSGSFASPTILGSTSSTTSGNITGAIPSNITTGNYQVRIVSSNPVRISNSENISIIAPPSVTAVNNGPLCVGNTLHLSTSNTPSTGVTFSWTGPGSYTANTQNASRTNITTAQAGAYIITATKGNCSAKDTTTVIVNPIPAKPTAGSNSIVCPNTTLNLTATHINSNATYSWTGPNSFTSSVQNPTINNATTSMAGDYIVTATVLGCTSLPDTTTVVVSITTPTPTASSNSPICSGQTLQLSASNITNATYSWTGPNGFTASVQNPTIANASNNASGTYYVTATVNGCISQQGSVTVVVNSAASIIVIPSSGNTICVNEQASFIAITNNAGTAPTYTWLKNGVSISGATSASYITNTLNTGDVISCVLSNVSQCPSLNDTSNAVTMTVLPWLVPSVTISASPSLIVAPWDLITFTATPINGGTNPTYQWKRNGQNIIGATNATWGTYQLSDGDTISVVLYSSYRCADPDNIESNPLSVTLKLGVTELSKDNLIVFPNPNNGTFTIKGSINTNDATHLTILNSVGQVVYTQVIMPKNNTVNETVNINKQLASGIYILQLKTENGIVTKRFRIN